MNIKIKQILGLAGMPLSMSLLASCSEPDSASSSVDSSSYSSEPSSSSVDPNTIRAGSTCERLFSFDSFSELDGFISTDIYMAVTDIEIIFPNLDYLGESLETSIDITAISTPPSDDGYPNWEFVYMNAGLASYKYKDSDIELFIPEFRYDDYNQLKNRAPFSGVFDPSKLSYSIVYSEDEACLATCEVTYEGVSRWSMDMELRWGDEDDKAEAENLLSLAISHMGYIYMPGVAYGSSSSS